MDRIGLDLFVTIEHSLEQEICFCFFTDSNRKVLLSKY